MNQRERAIEYFALKGGRAEFWSWSPDALNVVWADGTVVVARAELVVLLQHLQATGLPPFGAVVHLLAACCGKRLTLVWTEPSEDERQSFRFPCSIESGSKFVVQCQRVRMFSTPESISAAVARLAQLPDELAGILDDPRALPELADLLFSALEKSELSEGIISVLAEGRLTGQELNQPDCHYKYPTVLLDLALLSKTLDKLPPVELRSRRVAALEAEQSVVGAGQIGFITGKPQSEGVVTLLRKFELPPHREWHTAVALPSGFCAASLAVKETDSLLMVLRCTWEGTAQVAQWPTAGLGERVLLVPVGDERVLVHQPGCPVLPNQLLPQMGEAFARPLTMGGGGWLPTGTLQLASNEGQIWVLAHQPEEAVLTWRHANHLAYFDFDTHPPARARVGDGIRFLGEFESVAYNALRNPRRIELTCHENDGQRWGRRSCPEFEPLLTHPRELSPIVAAKHCSAVGLGQCLVIFRFLDVLMTYRFEQNIQKLAIGKSGRKTGIVICLERGVHLHWLGSDDVLPVDDEVISPVAAFTADGRLVVVGDHWGRIYELDRNGVTAFQSFAWSAPAPVAVMATASAAEFATLSPNGSVRVYRAFEGKD